MPQWVPFVGLTALVLTLLLALARASQGVVRDDPPQLPAGPGESGRHPGHDDVDGETVERHAAAEGTATPVPADGRPHRAIDRTRDGLARTPRTSTGTSTGTARPDLTSKVLLANVAVTQGLFGGAVLLGAVLFRIPAGAFGVTPDPWSTGLPAVGLGVAFGVVLWGASEASASVADAVGAGYDEALREMLAPETTRGWFVLLVGVLPVIAFVEELIFRAAVVGVPAAGLGVSPWALAALSSALFAVGHGAQGRVGIAVTGALGFVLAAGFVLSGSLIVVVVAHYLVNALEFLVHEYAGIDRVLVRMCSYRTQ